MSILVLGRVLKKSPQSGTNKLVLVLLADLSADGGPAFPSVRTMAERANVSERTVQRSLRELEAAGEFVLIPRTRENKSTTSSAYLLVPYMEREDMWRYVDEDGPCAEIVSGFLDAPRGAIGVTPGVTPTSPVPVTPTSPPLTVSSDPSEELNPMEDSGDAPESKWDHFYGLAGHLTGASAFRSRAPAGPRPWAGRLARAVSEALYRYGLAEMGDVESACRALEFWIQDDQYLPSVPDHFPIRFTAWVNRNMGRLTSALRSSSYERPWFDNPDDPRYGSQEAAALRAQEAI